MAFGRGRVARIDDKRVKHGRFGTPEYQSWADMCRRCSPRHTTKYKNWAGRGIIVCDAWRTDFRVFFAALGPRPSPRHTLERYDNNGHYEPGNVYWGTKKEQSRNRRCSTIYEHDGVRQCLAAWAEQAGLGGDTLHWRLTHGWSFAAAITTPRRRQRNNR